MVYIVVSPSPSTSQPPFSLNTQQVFQAWTSTTREHEEERAHKRCVYLTTPSISSHPFPLPPLTVLIPFQLLPGLRGPVLMMRQITHAHGLGAGFGTESGGEEAALWVPLNFLYCFLPPSLPLRNYL